VTPLIDPYPVQRGLTAAMREAGAKARDVQRMQAWAGQAAAFARAEPAAELVKTMAGSRSLAAVRPLSPAAA